MGTKMFKLGSFEEELYSSMKKSLVSNQLENKYSLDKLSKAADYISDAAELLDDTGFKVEADMLTAVLKRLANEQEADVNHDDEGDQVIVEPASKFDPFKDLELNVEETGHEPLELEPSTPEYLEFESLPATRREPSGKSEYLEFNSIAAKLATKLAAKKKV